MSQITYPDDWISGHLGDFTFESRLRLKDSDFESLPVYGVDNVVGLNTEPRYMAAELDRYKVIREGMFAYNPMRLNIGSIGYAFRGSHTGIVSPDYVVFGCLETLDSDYLHHFTQSFQWDQLTEDAGSGSVRFRIYYSEIARFPIVLPPLPEQRAIAAILSTWDDAIALTSRLIDALKRRKQALMQRLLTGQTRFPEFAGEEWEEVLLSDVTTVNPARRRLIDEDTEVSFITMADVSEEAQITNQTTRKYSEIKNGFTAFEQMDVLVAKITPCFENGKGALASNLENELGFGSTEFHVLRANAEKVLADFVFYHTVSEPFRQKGEGNMSGSAGQKRIPAEFLRSYAIKLPSLKE